MFWAGVTTNTLKGTCAVKGTLRKWNIFFKAKMCLKRLSRLQRGIEKNETRMSACLRNSGSRFHWVGKCLHSETLTPNEAFSGSTSEYLTSGTGAAFNETSLSLLDTANSPGGKGIQKYCSNTVYFQSTHTHTRSRNHY